MELIYLLIYLFIYLNIKFGKRRTDGNDVAISIHKEEF